MQKKDEVKEITKALEENPKLWSLMEQAAGTDSEAIRAVTAVLTERGVHGGE